MTHDSHGHGHHSHESDMKAAFTGLIVGAIAILAIMYGMVTLTNRMYASHSPAAAEAHK